MLSCPAVAERMASGSFEFQPEDKTLNTRRPVAVYPGNNIIQRFCLIGVIHVVFPLHYLQAVFLFIIGMIVTQISVLSGQFTTVENKIS